MKLTANKGVTATRRPTLEQIEYRLAKIWEMFPRLHLPEKYGDDLIERDHGSVVLPTTEDIARWPVKKLQQYFVLLITEDPEYLDTATLRIRIAQAVKARQIDAQHLQNMLDGKLALAPRDIQKPQSKKVRVVIEKKK